MNRSQLLKRKNKAKSKKHFTKVVCKLCGIGIGESTVFEYGVSFVHRHAEPVPYEVATPKERLLLCGECRDYFTRVPEEKRDRYLEDLRRNDKNMRNTRIRNLERVLEVISLERTQ